MAIMFSFVFERRSGSPSQFDVLKSFDFAAGDGRHSSGVWLKIGRYTGLKSNPRRLYWHCGCGTAFWKVDSKTQIRGLFVFSRRMEFFIIDFWSGTVLDNHLFAHGTPRLIYYHKIFQVLTVGRFVDHGSRVHLPVFFIKKRKAMYTYRWYM